RGVPPVPHVEGPRDHRRVPDRVRRRRVLRSGDGRLFPGARELRAGRPAEDAGAHRAGVVLHAVLRDLARRAGQAARRDPDGAGGAAAGASAVARPLPRQVDPLPRLDVQGRARGLRSELPRARLSRAAARDRYLSDAGAGIHGALLRVFPVDAVLHSERENQAGTGQGDEMRGKVARVAAAAAAVAALAASIAFGASEGVALEPANANINNTASLQRGAKYFVNYCLGCHSAQYVRYNKLAEGLKLTEDQLVQNLIFTDQQPFETMTNAMRRDDAERWFGITPPDLSLISRARGQDYIYNFLRGF